MWLLKDQTNDLLNPINIRPSRRFIYLEVGRIENYFTLKDTPYNPDKFHTPCEMRQKCWLELPCFFHKLHKFFKDDNIPYYINSFNIINEIIVLQLD